MPARAVRSDRIRPVPKDQRRESPPAHLSDGKRHSTLPVSPFVAVAGTTLYDSDELATALPLVRSAPADFYSGHTPPLRRFTSASSFLTMPVLLSPDRPHQAPVIIPVAVAVPVLVLIFSQSFTSLDGVTHRTRCRMCRRQATIVSTSVCPKNACDFRGQNTEAPLLPISKRLSQFGIVSGWDHWQGLSPLS